MARNNKNSDNNESENPSFVHYLLFTKNSQLSTYDSNCSRSEEVKSDQNIQFIKDKAETQSHPIMTNNNLKCLFT